MAWKNENVRVVLTSKEAEKAAKNFMTLRDKDVEKIGKECVGFKETFLEEDSMYAILDKLVSPLANKYCFTFNSTSLLEAQAFAVIFIITTGVVLKHHMGKVWEGDEIVSHFAGLCAKVA